VIPESRCVFFVSFAVRRGSISPTFSTFSEAVHAGLLIVRLFMATAVGNAAAELRTITRSFHLESKLSHFVARERELAASRGLRAVRERAISVLGTRNSPLSSNCEHIASYVRTGVAESPQLRGAGLLSLIGIGPVCSRWLGCGPSPITIFSSFRPAYSTFDLTRPRDGTCLWSEHFRQKATII
jgi:hypothetical protein